MNGHVLCPPEQEVFMHAHRENSVSTPLSVPENHRTPLIVLFSAFCMLFPLLGALSSQYEVRPLQLLVYFIVGLVVLATATRSDSTAAEDRKLQILVWSVSLCLILSSASYSEFLGGGDIQLEFPIFQEVSRTGVWTMQSSLPNSSLYSSVLSISILPAMVRAVSGLGAQEVFKFLYPLVYSTVPLVLYRIYRRISCPKAAFLSTYLFMAFYPFYGEVLLIGKQQVGELLLLLLLLVFLSGMSGKRSGAALALLLSVGLVVSQYTLSYIFLLLVAVSIFGAHITRKFVALCSLPICAVCGVMAAVWYVFTAGGSALNALTNFLSVFSQGMMLDFFSPSARPTEALQAAGLNWQTCESVGCTFLHDLNRLTQYIVPFCIVLGFIVFARRRSGSLAERKMLPLMSAALLLLGSAVILPLFGGIPFQRLYHISLLFVSPCFVIGAEMVESWVRKAGTSASRITAIFHTPVSWRGKKIVAATILLSYFLFVSGWVWAVTLDTPTSLVLDGSRIAKLPGDMKSLYYGMVDLRTDVNGAFWLRWRGENGQLCSDYISAYHVLGSYGELEVTLLRNCKLQRSYIFLSEENMLHGIGVDNRGDHFGKPLLYEISADVFTNDANRVYSNGGTAIYAGLHFA